MPDEVFANPRLADIYDALDPDRSDLEHYVSIVRELGARSVLDVGCGTGVLACLLAAEGVDVIGVDPAGASLDVARRRPGADRVAGSTGTRPRCTVHRRRRHDDRQRRTGVPDR
jgi:predicted RNA methylase